MKRIILMLSVILLGASRPITVDTKKVILLNGYPDIARTLASGSGDFLQTARAKDISREQKKKTLLLKLNELRESLTEAKKELATLKLPSDLFDDVETHLQQTTKLVGDSHFDEAASIVEAYKVALEKYVWALRF